MNNFTDLTWIKVLIESYKKNLAPDFVIGDKYKSEAADEILGQIKQFIKEANEVTKGQK